LVVGLSSALLLLVFGTSAVFAGSTGYDKVVSLPSDEVYEGDYMAWGDIVEIYGTVNGDVYVAGGHVTIDGHVNGDVLVAGGQVNVSGMISQDLRVGGGQVNITGVVGRNITAVGGDIQLTSAASIGGSVVAAGGNVIISTPVNGDLKAGAGSLTIAAPVNGNVDAGVETLRLSTNAQVNGDVNYYSQVDASIDSGASVSGQIHRKEIPAGHMPTEDQFDNFFAGLDVFTKSLSFMTTLVVGLLMVKFFPHFTQRGADTITEHPVASFGVGFLSLIVVPVSFVLLLITVLGIPLAFIGIVLFGIILYFSRVLVMVFLADWLLAKFNKKAKLGWVFVAGIFLYYLISLIPILGGLIKALVVVAGLGAFFMSYRVTWRAGHKAKIV
jgi:hypothetical protein